MKLNLGSADKTFEGFINVDKYDVFNPDVVHDLEVCPWPFDDNSVDEIKAHHVMEHLGQTSEQYMNILGELWRICEPNTLIEIFVPHPYHFTFIGDPTHVRVITPEQFSLFDVETYPDSPLMKSSGLQFKVENLFYVPETHYKNMLDAGEITYKQFVEMNRKYNNVCVEIKMLIKVIKDV